MRSRTTHFLAALALGSAIATTTIADASAADPPAQPGDAPKLGCVDKAADAARPKVVFQVNKAEDAPLILRFVTNYLKVEPEAQVAIVGYATGIDFMLKEAKDADGRAYAVQVNRLVDRGVAFKACNNTLAARNITSEAVLEAVSVVPSAVNEIVRLQTQENYSYFRN